MGVREVLAFPRVYEAWSRLVGGEKGRSVLVREYVRPAAGMRVLDLGCGPGELVPYLGEVTYVGVDVSVEYIEQARRRYGDRAEFRVGDATNLDDDLRGFDLVLAFGVIHHLDDESALRLLRGARDALSERGRFVSVDPTVIADDHAAARLLVSWDRGGHVRAPGEYKRLAGSVFARVLCDVRRDLLRIPYTHFVLESEVRREAQ
jgi:SAM-dependent methyltransferase